MAGRILNASPSYVSSVNYKAYSSLFLCAWLEFHPTHLCFGIQQRYQQSMRLISGPLLLFISWLFAGLEISATSDFLIFDSVSTQKNCNELLGYLYPGLFLVCVWKQKGSVMVSLPIRITTHNCLLANVWKQLLHRCCPYIFYIVIFF